MGRTHELHRKSIRLHGYDYSAAGGYYVTLNTFRRACLFGEVVQGEVRLSALGNIVQECWQAIPEHFPNAQIDEFVIMPDHLHGIILLFDDREVRATHALPGQSHASPGQSHASPRPHAPPERAHGPEPHSLGAIIGSFKSAVSRRAGRELSLAQIWHRNYYEHIIRDQKDHERIAAYIRANPSHWNADGGKPIKK